MRVQQADDNRKVNWLQEDTKKAQPKSKAEAAKARELAKRKAQEMDE